MKHAGTITWGLLASSSFKGTAASPSPLPGRRRQSARQPRRAALQAATRRPLRYAGSCRWSAGRSRSNPRGPGASARRCKRRVPVSEGGRGGSEAGQTSDQLMAPASCRGHNRPRPLCCVTLSAATGQTGAPSLQHCPWEEGAQQGVWVIAFQAQQLWQRHQRLCRRARGGGGRRRCWRRRCCHDSHRPPCCSELLSSVTSAECSWCWGSGGGESERQHLRAACSGCSSCQMLQINLGNLRSLCESSRHALAPAASAGWNFFVEETRCCHACRDPQSWRTCAETQSRSHSQGVARSHNPPAAQHSSFAPNAPAQPRSRFGDTSIGSRRFGDIGDEPRLAAAAAAAAAPTPPCRPPSLRCSAPSSCSAWGAA